MTTNIRRAGATGLLIFLVAACGGASAAETDVDADVPQSTAAAQATVDPDAPEDAGAVIDEEEVPVPGTTLDACEIVTADDVKAAFATEEDVLAGTFEANPTVLSPGHSECTYAGEYGRVIVSLTPEDGANLYDAAYGAYDGIEVIPGIGDGAFWSQQNRRGFIWQDRVAVMLTIFPGATDLTGLDVTEALGRAVIDKL